MKKEKICITGLGMISAVGPDVKTSCASIRAGIVRPLKLNNYYVYSRDYEDYEDGLVTGYPIYIDEYDNSKEKIFSMLENVLKDLHCYSGAEDGFIKDSPLFISLPSKERNLINKNEIMEFLEHIQNYNFNPSNVTLFDIGNSGMMFAMTDAMNAMHDNKYKMAMLVGVDTLVGYDDLKYFNDKNRLKTELNSTGFMPGEAAAAILIENQSSAQKRGAPIEAIIQSCATGFEPNSVLSEAKPSAVGLSKVINTIVEAEDSKKIIIDIIISDINGEDYRFHELGLLHTKGLTKIQGEKIVLHPASVLGDTGAASAGISICVAVRGMARGYLKSSEAKELSNALILSSSDTGERGGILLKPYKEE